MQQSLRTIESLVTEKCGPGPTALLSANAECQALPPAAELESEFCQDPHVASMHIKIWEVLL